MITNYKIFCYQRQCDYIMYTRVMLNISLKIYNHFDNI